MVCIRNYTLHTQCTIPRSIWSALNHGLLSFFLQCGSEYTSIWLQSLNFFLYGWATNLSEVSLKLEFFTGFLSFLSLSLFLFHQCRNDYFFVSSSHWFIDFASHFLNQDIFSLLTSCLFPLFPYVLNRRKTKNSWFINYIIYVIRIIIWKKNHNDIVNDTAESDIFNTIVNFLILIYVIMDVQILFWNIGFKHIWTLKIHLIFRLQLSSNL